MTLSEKVSLLGIQYMGEETNEEGETVEIDSVRELNFLKTDEQEILLSYFDWKTDKETEIGYMNIPAFYELADRLKEIWPLPKEVEE